MALRGLLGLRLGRIGARRVAMGPELQFEDFEDLEILSEMEEIKGNKAKVQRSPPLKDGDLKQVPLATLGRDEFVWAVGRAATLQLAEARLWTELRAVVEALSQKEALTASELCRLLQALAYAPLKAPVEQKLLQRLFKAFAERAKDFSDERLMRVLYAYGKLSSKRGLRLPRFMDFATSEVVERGLRSWRQVRILESIGGLPDTAEFKALRLGRLNIKL